MHTLVDSLFLLIFFYFTEACFIIYFKDLRPAFSILAGTEGNPEVVRQV